VIDDIDMEIQSIIVGEVPGLSAAASLHASGMFTIGMIMATIIVNLF
jgi:ethanolamine ammonia-lyase small subunit